MNIHAQMKHANPMPMTLLGTTLGISMGIISYAWYVHQKKVKGKIEIEIERPHKSYKGDKLMRVRYITRNSPHVTSFDSHNLECLGKKGYIMNDPPYGLNSGDVLYEIQKADNSEVNRDTFISDCRACKVYSEARYKEEGFWSDEYKYMKKRIPWTKKYVTEEEKWEKA